MRTFCTPPLHPAPPRGGAEPIGRLRRSDEAGRPGVAAEQDVAEAFLCRGVDRDVMEEHLAVAGQTLHRVRPVRGVGPDEQRGRPHDVGAGGDRFDGGQPNGPATVDEGTGS